MNDIIANWGAPQSLFSQEAEAATIGAVLVNPSLYRIVAATLNPQDFFILRHRYIWQALADLSESKTTIDYLTVCDRLKGQGKLEEIGGPAYLTELINATPTSVHGEVYGKLVETFAGRRQLMVAADEIRALALDSNLPYDKVESEAVRIVTKSQRAAINDLVPMSISVQQHREKVAQAIAKPDDMLGLPSSLVEMNNILHGYQKGKLYVCAGRPGMGKTSYLVTEAAYLASLGKRIAFFTMEMSTQEVVNGIFMNELEVDSFSILSGKLEQMGRYKQYLTAADKIAGWKLFIDDTNGITAAELKAKCLKMQDEMGLDMVFVDYLQLMGSDGRYDLRTYEVGAISKALKEMTKELNIPVLTAAQLNRAVDDRQDKRPQLSDLRESGNIEQDTDVGMFFYRDDYYNPLPPPEDENMVVLNEVEISVLKHRDGARGVANVGFKGKFKKFVNQTPEPLNEPIKFSKNGRGERL